VYDSVWNSAESPHSREGASVRIYNASAQTPINAASHRSARGKGADLDSLVVAAEFEPSVFFRRGKVIAEAGKLLSLLQSPCLAFLWLGGFFGGGAGVEVEVRSCAILFRISVP